MKYSWMLFARTGMINLAQPTADAEDGTGDEAEDEATSDASKDDAPKLETLEDYQAALKAREAELEAAKRLNRNLDRRSKKDLKRIQALEAAGASRQEAEDEVDADKIRTEATAEAAQRYNSKLVELAAKAALASKVKDPQYAAWLLRDKLTTVDVNDGDVDQDAINDLVDELLEEKPELKVAQGDSGFQGDADQGARKADRRSAEQKLLEDIAEAEKARDFTRSIALKQRYAALLETNKKG